MRLGTHGKVPPLAAVRLKAAANHRLAQDEPVFPLCRRNRLAVRPAHGVHEVKARPHVRLLKGLRAHQRQIHRAAAAVRGAPRDIPLREHLRLVDARKLKRLAPLRLLGNGELRRLAACLYLLFAEGRLRAIRVEHLEQPALSAQRIRRAHKRVGDLHARHDERLRISLRRAAHEVVRASIFRIDDAVLNPFVEVHKALRQQPRLGHPSRAHVHSAFPPASGAPVCRILCASTCISCASKSTTEPKGASKNRSIAAR